MPARNRDHPGHPRGEASLDLAPGLTGQLWQRPRHLLGVAVGGVMVAILALGMSNPSASAATASPTIDPLRANHGVVVQGHTPPAISAKSWIVVDADSG